MRILFLSQVLPYPLDAGPKVRSYYVLRHLSKKHDVTLLAFSRPSDPPQAIEHLRQICPQVITVPMRRSRLQDGQALARSLATGRSFIIARDDSPEMAAKVDFKFRNSKIDFIHSDQLWMAQYVLRLNVETLKRAHVRTVLDQHNAVHLIPQRMAADARNPLFRRFLELEAQRLARYELQACHQFDHVVWVAQEDYLAVQYQQQLLSQQKTNLKSKICNPQSPIRNSHSPIPNSHFPIPNSHSPIRNSVIPICVDPSSVQPIYPLPVEPNILFIGGMHWPPNAEGICWFVQKVMPLVREQVPDARCFVVGKSPPKELMRTDGLVVTGYVEEIEPYWKQGRIFIVPLQAGGGMRVKILDAWAHGLSVVSTTIGVEGINSQDGKNIRIADTPEDFANSIVSLLQGEEATSLASCGRAAVEANYDWRDSYQAWDAIYGF